MKGRRVTEWLTMMAKVLIRIGGVVSAYICLPAMLILMTVDPFLRYALGSPFYWSNEVTTLLMVVMFFLSLGVTLAKGIHARVTVVFQLLPRKVQDVFWVGITLVGLFYVGFLGYFVTRLCIDSFTIGVRTDTSEMPIFPWQMIGVLGFLVFLITMIMFLKERIAIALGTKQRPEDEEKLTDLGF